MTDTLDTALSPESVVERCLADLAANAPSEAVLAKLREVESSVGSNATLKARFLRTRAIATNRLGFGSEALGDLHEARRLLEPHDQPGELAKIFLAIATVFVWRGEGREAALALLRAVAEATIANDLHATALALIETGRLQMEIGRPNEAQAILAHGLALGAEMLPQREYQRAWVNLLQATVGAGLVEKARELRPQATTVLEGASNRLRMLTFLEWARLDSLLGDREAAEAQLANATGLARDDPDSFEHIEIAHAQAELALAKGDASRAAELLQKVVARCATDDLAAREVAVRLLQAQAFEALGKPDEAERTLGAALRRAVARGLTGHADRVRSEIAARGSNEGVGLAGDVPAAAASPDPAARFVRQRPLGAGGFARVMRAYDLELGIEVALKRNSLKDVYDPAVRGRLLEAARTEMAATARLNHPGVARVFGLLADADGDAILIEEFVEGPTLRDAMKTKLEPSRALDIMARVALSLAAVHAAGVIHRDVKPDNIILRGGTAPVLVDFGIAGLQQRGANVRAGGTPRYMPPEQARGGRADARADLYALGVTSFELLSGELPESEGGYLPLIVASRWRKRGVCARLVAAGIDRDTADLIACMMSPHPYWRPGSAAEVGAGLAEAVTRAARAR